MGELSSLPTMAEAGSPRCQKLGEVDIYIGHIGLCTLGIGTNDKSVAGGDCLVAHRRQVSRGPIPLF